MAQGIIIVKSTWGITTPFDSNFDLFDPFYLYINPFNYAILYHGACAPEQVDELPDKILRDLK